MTVFGHISLFLSVPSLCGSKFTFKSSYPWYYLFLDLCDIFKLLNQIVGYIFSFKACFLAKILGEKYLSGEYFFIALERLINLHHSSQQATNWERSSSSSARSLYAAEDYVGYSCHRNLFPPIFCRWIVGWNWFKTIWNMDTKNWPILGKWGCFWDRNLFKGHFKEGLKNGSFRHRPFKIILSPISQKKFVGAWSARQSETEHLASVWNLSLLRLPWGHPTDAAGKLLTEVSC